MTPAKGYTEMKDSGIEWVGMIPAHWHIKVLFQLVSQVKNKNKDLSETNLLSLSYGKIKRKNIDDTEGLLPASFDSYNIIENNDIVLRLTDLQNDHTSLRVGRATERGIITSAYITIRPTNSRMSEYLYYLLHSFDIKKGFYGMGSGVRQGLNYDEVKMLKLPLPPLNEESAIAAYLDTQCAKIDEIIAQAKASMEDYKQWKASIIYEAVTKGLNPNVEMKDSGVEWIGKIPKQWGTKQIRYLFELRDERNDLPLEQVNLISLYTDLGVVQHSDLEKITGNKAVTADGYKQVYPNDIVVNIILCWMGAIGMSNYAGVTSPAYDVYKPKDSQVTLSKYYHYLFRTARFNGKCYTVGRGIMAMRWRTYSSEFRAIKVPVPSYKTQVQIVEYLDSVCSKIDDLISEKQSLIDNLESYKKSLIYEVVTGKRRV